MSAHAASRDRPIPPRARPVQAQPASPVQLAVDHRRHLATSGLSDQEIDASGCFTRMHPRFGRCLVLPMYGFRRRDGELQPLAVEYLYRPDKPRLEQRDDGRWRTRKYEREWGSRSTLFCHPDDLALLADRGIPIYVVEGVKKMLKLRAELRRAGRPGVVVHANGVWTNQRKSADGEYRLYDDWFEFPLRGRRVILVPDSDAEPGGTTEQAWGVIAQLLDEAGARVSRTHLYNTPDGSKVGPDDFFVAGGTLDALLATVTEYGAWLAPLNPTGDVVSGAEHRAVKAERDAFKARYELDRQLLSNRNLKHGQVRALQITLDAIAYNPAGPVRPAQETSLDTIAARGMSKSTLERNLSDLAKAGLIAKDSTLIRDPITNAIIASQLEIAPGPALAVAKTVTVPDQKPSGGPRPTCERCGRENVKQVMVRKCLDCGHISGLGDEYETVGYDDGASYQTPPEIVAELRKTRINTPEPQIGNQSSVSGDAPAAPPQNGAITLTEDLSPQIEHTAVGGSPGAPPHNDIGTSHWEPDDRPAVDTAKNPHESTGTSNWEYRDPPRTVVSRSIDWGDFPSLQVKRARDALEVSA
jgi:hypothetical protein